jgi:hypothetical protein
VTAADEEPVDEPSIDRRLPRRWLVVIGVAAIVVVGFFAITGVTGLAGPSWLHRYPYGDLRALADAVNTDAGPLRTPDDCWRTTPSTDDARRDPDGPLREIAKVDYLRSRVVVRAYANQSGLIDRTTRRAVLERIDAVETSNPAFSRSMIVLEPSPDGWSPLVSCRLVTRGWITGF